jgi:hypothetical protein
VRGEAGGEGAGKEDRGAAEALERGDWEGVSEALGDGREDEREAGAVNRRTEGALEAAEVAAGEGGE